MKKTLSLLLSATIVFCALPMIASSAETESSKLDNTIIEKWNSGEDSVLAWITYDDSLIHVEKESFVKNAEAEMEQMIESYMKDGMGYVDAREKAAAWYENELKQFDGYRTAGRKIVEQLGLKDAFVSGTTNMIEANVTKEQIEQVIGLDEIIYVGLSYSNLYENETIAEDFAPLVATSTDFQGDQMIYADDYKVDMQETTNGVELIIYDIPLTDITTGKFEAGKVRINTDKYTFAGIDAPTSAVLYSDYSLSAGMYNGKSVTIRYFVKDQLPVMWGDISKTKSILNVNAERGYDIAQYIYDNITPGDIDNDGILSISDCSTILEAYARNAVCEKIPLNMNMFDYDGNGEVDISDASDVLIQYAKDVACIN
jgi:hypothetical protein